MSLREILEELLTGKYNYTDERVKKQKTNQAIQKIRELMLSEEEMAFEIYKQITGYSEYVAKDVWTGKHYSSKAKDDASKIAYTILEAMVKKLEPFSVKVRE